MFRKRTDLRVLQAGYLQLRAPVNSAYINRAGSRQHPAVIWHSLVRSGLAELLSGCRPCDDWGHVAAQYLQPRYCITVCSHVKRAICRQRCRVEILRMFRSSPRRPRVLSVVRHRRFMVPMDWTSRSDGERQFVGVRVLPKNSALPHPNDGGGVST